MPTAWLSPNFDTILPHHPEKRHAQYTSSLKCNIISYHILFSTCIITPIDFYESSARDWLSLSPATFFIAARCAHPSYLPRSLWWGDDGRGRNLHTAAWEQRNHGGSFPAPPFAWNPTLFHLSQVRRWRLIREQRIAQWSTEQNGLFGTGKARRTRPKRQRRKIFTSTVYGWSY